MNTLVIYDQEGYIITQMSGDVREPIGVPFLWVDVPEGKIVAGIDITGETHTPIFEDLPKSEIQLISEKVSETEQAILELSMILGGM